LSADFCTFVFFVILFPGEENIYIIVYSYYRIFL